MKKVKLIIIATIFIIISYFILEYILNKTIKNSYTNISKSYQEQLNGIGNRSDIVSVGSFLNFEPGDHIKVSYAYIFARKKEDGNQTTNACFKLFLRELCCRVSCTVS